MQLEGMTRHERLGEIMYYLMEMHDKETNKDERDLRKALSGAIHALFDAMQAAGRIDSPDTFSKH